MTNKSDFVLFFSESRCCERHIKNTHEFMKLCYLFVWLQLNDFSIVKLLTYIRFHLCDVILNYIRTIDKPL